MQATKDHISLETAKLLKDCLVDQGHWYTDDGIFHSVFPYTTGNVYPAYTWQEILWEHAEEFWEDETKTEDHRRGMDYATTKIKRFLQKKEYDNADLYFRKHCILIK